MPLSHNMAESSMGHRTLLLVYNHPEFYPPTLNTVDQLSEIGDCVVILSRNNKVSSWTYPGNVKSFVSGRFMEIARSERKSAFWKAGSFLRFLIAAFRLKRKYRPVWILCYDSIPLLAARLMNMFSFKKSKIWYHNHDISDRSALRNLSIGSMAAKSEQKSFRNISLFTLPSRERLSYFPMEDFRGRDFILPNFPSRRRYAGAEMNDRMSSSILKFIYQGYVSDGHGLEEVIRFISVEESAALTIVGIGDVNYIAKLKKLVYDLKVSEKVIFKEAVPYQDLKRITLEHHIGLAILKPVSIAFKTAALASNKIYEYAACGLAVVFFDDSYHREYLSRYDWAFPTDLTEGSLRSQTRFIRENYSSVSTSAIRSFESDLNFENAFLPVKEYLQTTA